MLEIPLSIQEKLPNQQAGLLTAAFPFSHVQPLQLLSKSANTLQPSYFVPKVDLS